MKNAKTDKRIDWLLRHGWATPEMMADTQTQMKIASAKSETMQADIKKLTKLADTLLEEDKDIKKEVEGELKQIREDKQTEAKLSKVFKVNKNDLSLMKVKALENTIEKFKKLRDDPTTDEKIKLEMNDKITLLENTLPAYKAITKLDEAWSQFDLMISAALTEQHRFQKQQISLLDRVSQLNQTELSARDLDNPEKIKNLPKEEVEKLKNTFNAEKIFLKIPQIFNEVQTTFDKMDKVSNYSGTSLLLEDLKMQFNMKVRDATFAYQDYKTQIENNPPTNIATKLYQKRKLASLLEAKKEAGFMVSAAQMVGTIIIPKWERKEAHRKMIETSQAMGHAKSAVLSTLRREGRESEYNAAFGQKAPESKISLSPEPSSLVSQSSTRSSSASVLAGLKINQTPTYANISDNKIEVVKDTIDVATSAQSGPAPDAPADSEDVINRPKI